MLRDDAGAHVVSGLDNYPLSSGATGNANLFTSAQATSGSLLRNLDFSSRYFGTGASRHSYCWVRLSHLPVNRLNKSIMDIRFDGKHALVTGAGKGTSNIGLFVE